MSENLATAKTTFSVFRYGLLYRDGIGGYFQMKDNQR